MKELILSLSVIYLLLELFKHLFQKDVKSPAILLKFFKFISSLNRCVLMR